MSDLLWLLMPAWPPLSAGLAVLIGKSIEHAERRAFVRRITDERTSDRW